MANTVISLETSIDVVEKQRLLVQEALGPDGVYIRLRETLKEYFDEGSLKNPEIANVVGQTLASLANSITSQAMGTALDWAAREKALVLQKEELEYKIDAIKVEVEKAEYDRDTAQAMKHLTQAKMIREYGTPTLVNDDVAFLPDEGKVYEEIRNIQQATANAEVQERQLEAGVKELNARTHKLVADTFVNHGMYSGYTINENGITGTTKLSTGYVTLSDLNKEVAAEQAKGYVYNAYSNAASSSAGMIGTLVSAEIPGLDPTQYLTTWKSAVDKLNNLVVPTIDV